MRVIFFCLFLALTCCFNSFAQVGNEWIVYNQQYFKIPVAKEGIYKLNYLDLQSAGFPVGSVDPGKIQLFHRGLEQAIYIEGEDDGQFNPTDFIEFYGVANDGTLDRELYETPAQQPHKLLSIFSDTTSFFLTISSASGKRMPLVNEGNTGGIPPETYHFDEKTMLFAVQFAAGVDYGSGTYKTVFDLGEGWTDLQIVQNTFKDYTLDNLVNTVTTAPPPEIEILVVGRGPMQHQAEVYVGSGLRLIGTLDFFGYETFKFSQSIDWTDISPGGTLQVRIKVNGVGGEPDRLSASYIKLKYPQQFDVAGEDEKTFILTPNPGGKSYLELINASPGLRLYDVTDHNNVIGIGTTGTAPMTAIVPSTVDTRRIYSVNSTLTPSIKKVSFREIIPAQHNYIIISSPVLRKPAFGYNDPVKAYADYRASSEGGAFDTLVVNVQQLYDQFNYGETSPLAIMHLMRFLSGINVPKYLLLIGRGLDVYYAYHRYPQWYVSYPDLVPTAGFPGSDAAFTAGIAGAGFEPAVPTGRIPALKPEDVAAYLDKVKEMEQIPYKELWRKNILHLSGGIAEGEPELFKGYMKDFQAAAESYFLGGKVSALAKHSKDIQHINVAEQVNEGLNLITFFGHSSSTETDFDIGYVTDPILGYNNKGKYPMLLVNGCNVGSFFLPSTLFGENWILAKDRGALGFIGHSGYGFSNLLKKYTSSFYAVAYEDSTFIRKGIGDIQKETARSYMATTGSSALNITQVQQMILLGDPAVRLFGATKPDLEIKDNDLTIETFDGKPVSALTDSFAVHMIVRNYGQARRDTIRIEVLRTLNDNSTISYDSLFPSTKYSDTLTLVVRKGRESGFGNNSFRVTLDPDNVLHELDEGNNSASKLLFIPLNGTRHLFPTEFAIVNAQQTTLSFQTTDLLSDERDFLLELDTTNTFDSPFRTQFVVKGKVLARQVVTLLQLDTMAYYWRTKLAEPALGESKEWTQSSFTYINSGAEGWAQVHFPQYLDNEATGLVADDNLRRLKFAESKTSIEIETYGDAYPSVNMDAHIKIAGAEYNIFDGIYVCRDNSVNLIAFDRKSTVPYLGVKFEWYNRGPRTCGRLPWVINNFVPAEMATGNNDDLIQYVDNVQTGDSVLLFTMGNGFFSNWPAAAKTKLGELGISISQINSLQDGEPVVFLGRKGIAPGDAKMFTASTAPKDAQTIKVTGTITGGYSDGFMNSGPIGPAIQWDSLFTRLTEIEAQDLVSFDLIGIKLNGGKEIILDNVTGDKDLQTIDAEQYPYLELVFNAGDDVSLTPAQLNKWIVTFTPAPEGLLMYNGIHEQETLIEGPEWKGEYGFINISDKDFTDSLTVRYEVFNQTTRTSVQEEIKIKPPVPGDTTSFEVRVATANQGGLNDVNVYVNPHLLPEQYYDNNLLQLVEHLNVITEELNPVLDVSFDGRYLVNGDYVSPNPIIRAKIWDENKSILKKDTAGVRIFMTYPCDQTPCSATRILLTDADVKWFPATDTSPFNIEFTPNDLADGEYGLRVEGADARGNASGLNPYEVTFNVLNETTVVISDPYPNPSSQDVYFKIILSGNALPDQFDLELVNVSGQLQSQLSMSDFPEFHIGTNEVVWNGTNRNGNPLPGGVYIYKLALSVNGEQIRTHGKLILVK